MPFIIIFLAISYVELSVFAIVGEHIGVWSTLSLALITAIIGGLLVKHQGLQTLMSMRQSINKGGLPLNEIFDGFCLVAAGALLITPGFVTDAIGFALLIPPVRIIVRNLIRKHTNWSASDIGPMGQEPRAPQDPTVIEGEYERVDEDK